MANIIPSKNALLKPTTVGVKAEGELVVLRIGNTELKMNYEDAFTMSQWLRIRAKEAKRNAGDFSRHWSAMGTLELDNQGKPVTRG